MKKLCFLTSLFICLNLPLLSHANTETQNWCGIYFENAEQGFLRIPIADIRQGSKTCNLENYAERAQMSGTVNIAIDITRSPSTLGHWRKFDSHVLEVNGKLKNGEITHTRFIRDMGI